MVRVYAKCCCLGNGYHSGRDFLIDILGLYTVFGGINQRFEERIAAVFCL